MEVGAKGPAGPAADVILRAARSQDQRMRALRRRLHEYPETGLILPRTRDSIVAEIGDLGIDVELGTSVTSVVAVIRGAGDGPTVVLRADMDALPISESATASPRSLLPARMHACGHDLHSAMLAGVARVLAGLRAAFTGSVALIWQPGEEGHDGMRAMLDEGLLDLLGPRVVASYGLHTMSDTLPPGVFSGKPGVSHASSAMFEITVTGAGGHAAFPHAARDPVPAAAEIVLALQASVSRTINIFDPAVITVAAIQAGGPANVIPDQVVMSGTARAFSPDTARRLPELVNTVARGVAAAHGLDARVDYRTGYPPVVNDAAEVAVLRAAVEDTLGPRRFVPLSAPIPAGDDYARLLERVPGAFFLVGAGLQENGNLHPNHSAGARFDEAVLADGAAVLSVAALRRLHTGRLPEDAYKGRST